MLSAAHAVEVVEQASRIEKMAATVKALAAARVAETGSWRTEGDRSAAHQLARRTGTSVVQAAAAIDTARRLVSLPETAAAARRGELSAEQACAIADAAGDDPGAEHDLLEAARRSPLAELREQCARTKAAAYVDLEARRRRIHQRRSLRSFTDPEGEWHLHCRNNPEVGARIMAALDPIREQIFRQARAEARHEPPDAYAADALAEMARRSVGRMRTPPTPCPRWPAAQGGGCERRYGRGGDRRSPRRDRRDVRGHRSRRRRPRFRASPARRDRGHGSCWWRRFPHRDRDHSGRRGRGRRRGCPGGPASTDQD